MKGWLIVIAGALIVLGGVLLIPGMPGCKYCGQVYNSTFLQNLAYPELLIVVGIVVAIVGAYVAGTEHKSI